MSANDRKRRQARRTVRSVSDERGFVPPTGVVAHTMSTAAVHSLRAQLRVGNARHVRRANGHAGKLHGRGPRGYTPVARRLRRILLDSNARSAADVTPRWYCSAQAARPPDRSRAVAASAACSAAQDERCPVQRAPDSALLKDSHRGVAGASSTALCALLGHATQERNR